MSYSTGMTDELSKSSCECKIICDCSKNKEKCDCNYGSLYTCNYHQTLLDSKFKKRLFNFFVGEVMKETKGQANPAIVNKLLRKKLDEI